jgi:hypothetical protein
VVCRTPSSFGSQHRCDATSTFRDLNVYPELDERKRHAVTGKRLEADSVRIERYCGVTWTDGLV